jgi:predicted Zn-dependent protease
MKNFHQTKNVRKIKTNPIDAVETELKSLEPPDSLYLKAAEGWLELGDCQEANEELERITPAMRVHPNVFQMRYEIYAKAKKWELAVEVARALTEMLPENSWGFIHYAYSLHELKRTKEAYAVLIPVVGKFSDYIIRYTLACYSCQLGNLRESIQWLKKAIELADKKEIRLMALKDPDLKSIRKLIRSI